MNNELIKRIDEEFFFVVDADGQQRLDKLLADCRAEIASLHEATQQQAVVIERLSKPYVPMTDAEISQMMQDWYNDTSDQTSLPRFIEAAVIKRAGLEVKHD